MSPVFVKQNVYVSGQEVNESTGRENIVFKTLCNIVGNCPSWFQKLWLRLSERPWDPKPLRRQSLSPWQGHLLCPVYFTLLGPEPDQLANDGYDSSKEGQPKIGMVTKRPLGKDLGAI